MCEVISKGFATTTMRRMRARPRSPMASSTRHETSANVKWKARACH